MNSLSLCVLTKNNETTIEKCLSSAKPIVDEIIIADTGSIDKTIDICLEYTSNIFKTTFDNDFSKARNFALSKATKDFILFLDSDEYLPFETCTRIKEYLNTENYKAYSILINNVNSKETKRHCLTRLFINDRDVYYEHRIHEQMEWSFMKKYSTNDIYFSDMIIHHTGYSSSPDEDLKKIKRNSLILNSYTDEEKDEYYYYLIGCQDFYNKNFFSALTNLNKALLPNAHKTKGQFKYIFLIKLACLDALGNFAEIFKLALPYILREPNFKDIYYYLYRAYISVNDYKNAFNSLLNFRNIPHDDVCYPTIINIPIQNIDQTLFHLSSI